MLNFLFLAFIIVFDGADLYYVGDFHQAVSFQYLSDLSIRQYEFGRASEQCLVVESRVETYVCLCQV